MPIRIPLSWLREYIEINVTPEELARRLTLAGQEVEHIVSIGEEWENMYTGRVIRLEQHPNADRLYLATVEYGAGKEITVVTGAPNIQEGDHAVLGLIGARYIDQHLDPPKLTTLKPAKIRGVQTEGMVMSEAEMGLSEEHLGIIRLPKSTPLGLPIREVLGDTVLEIDVSPNNGRVLSMVGMAREVAAIFGGLNAKQNLRYPSTEWRDGGPPIEELLQIEIDDPDLCARYSGAVILGVKIGPSPAWIQRRITLAGMRPVNNVVDITNYVMLEMGQPLHAFNYRAVQGRKIIVRRARPGEHLTTIDHVDRALDPNMLAICDVEKPVALAGVMGGADSEIGQEGTVDVLLESAHFAPLNIRRTARLLKLPSEASYRFERFVDPNLTVPAMKRAAELIRELAGGTIARGYVDNYPRPLKPLRIHFYTSEVDRLLGVHAPPSKIADILRRLEYTVDAPPNADAVGADTTMLVDVPSYRNDVTLPCDLVEDVARIMGYDLIPETLLEGGLPPQEPNRELDLDERLRDLMVACGLDEIITYGLTYSGSLEKLVALEEDNSKSKIQNPKSKIWDTSRKLVTIVNPLSSRQDVMRPTLLPNMLDALRANLRVRPEEAVRVFEVGKIFLTPTEAEIAERRKRMAEERARYPRMDAWEPVEGEERLPVEPRRLAGLMSGPRDPRSRFNPDVTGPDDQLDFFDAKGVVEELLRHLHVGGLEYVPVDAPFYHPGRVAMVYAGGLDLGVVGELHPAVVEAWDLHPEGTRQRVCAFDLSVEAISRAMPERHLYAQVSPYAPVRQDMAFVVDEETPAALVAETIRKAVGAAGGDVVLFDIYRGKPIPEGHKSLAFAVSFAATDKPLAEEEVARLRKRIEGRLERELGARLRT